MGDDDGRAGEHVLGKFAVMVGAPVVLEVGGGDELEAGGGDGGIAENVEIFRREVAGDAP